MISRRSVRVKVMQAIYAYESSDNVLQDTFRKSLHTKIYSVIDLYLYLLFIIREVANEVEVVYEIKTSKHLPTAEDLSYNTKLLSNTFVQHLNKDEAFLKALRDSKVTRFSENEIIKHLYRLLHDSPEFAAYSSSSKNFDSKEEKNIIKYIFNNIILSDLLFHEHIEDVFPSWEDDADFVVGAIRDLISKSNKSFELHIHKASVKSKIDELSEFGEKLFDKAILSKEILMMDIEEYLKNWEIERIAVIDLILIRMGLTEFTDFPSIPVKVTMNEYIEVAKSYSSPKSKDFVNGVLDRMLKDMTKKGLIAKTGRGLMDK